MKGSAFALACPLTAFALACTPTACSSGSTGREAPYPAPVVEKEGQVVAKVGEVVLTTRELEKRIREESPLTRAQLTTPEAKKKFVENQVRYEALAQEGWRRGLQNDPRIQAELRRAIVQRLMRDELDRLASTVDVSEEELRAAYQAKDAEYNKPERVRLSVIVRRPTTEGARRAAKTELEALKKQIEAAEKSGKATAFAEAAQRVSEDEASKNAGGDLQFLTRDEVVARLGEPIAQAWVDRGEVGAIDLGETADALLLIKKTGKRRASARPLEAVKPQLRAQLLAEKKQKALEAYVAGLAAKTASEISEAAVAALEVDPVAPSPTRPPLMPTPPASANSATSANSAEGASGSPAEGASGNPAEGASRMDGPSGSPAARAEAPEAEGGAE